MLHVNQLAARIARGREGVGEHGMGRGVVGILLEDRPQPLELVTCGSAVWGYEK